MRAMRSLARAETYHAQNNTVTLTLYTESGTKETTLPLTTDVLGEWSRNKRNAWTRIKKEPILLNQFLFFEKFTWPALF